MFFASQRSVVDSKSILDDKSSIPILDNATLES